jgi:hypothetical protein
MQEIAIVGPGEYQDVVVEIDCHPAFTAVVGYEKGKFFVEVFNFEASQIEEFTTGRRTERNAVDLDTFLASIEKAKASLAYQRKEELGSK